MFFVCGDTIVKIDRLPGESNKIFYKKGFQVAGKGVSSDAELKKAVAEFNLVNY
tara:strand:- start:14 stop:175 length:162 start_codon:yes stop_codon:yes gene_type:complete